MAVKAAKTTAKGAAKAPRKALRLSDAINAACPWSGDPVRADSLTLYKGEVVGFCNPGCRDKFAKAASLFDAAIEGRAPARAKSR